MAAIGVTHDERRIEGRVSTEWGCPYDPREDFALPGIGSAIARGSLAAATQHVFSAALHGIKARMHASDTASMNKGDAISAPSGRLVTAHCASTIQERNTSRAAMSRRYVAPSK